MLLPATGARTHASLAELLLGDAKTTVRSSSEDHQATLGSEPIAPVQEYIATSYRESTDHGMI